VNVCVYECVYCPRSERGLDTRIKGILCNCIVLRELLCVCMRVYMYVCTCVCECVCMHVCSSFQ
jgi:hypothetical protein